MKKSLTKKQINLLHDQFKKLGTKEEKIEWFSNGVVDAERMIYIPKEKNKNIQDFWTPTINGYKFYTGNGICEHSDKKEAIQKAIELKKEFQEKLA